MVANRRANRRLTDSFTDSGHSDTPKSLRHERLQMEPVVGVEPTTYGLQNRCSTTELNWLTLKNPALHILAESGSMAS
jgi:hypothetical protein